MNERILPQARQRRATHAVPDWQAPASTGKDQPAIEEYIPGGGF
jgi:hypothetical protein